MPSISAFSWTTGQNDAVAVQSGYTDSDYFRDSAWTMAFFGYFGAIGSRFFLTTCNELTAGASGENQHVAALRHTAGNLVQLIELYTPLAESTATLTVDTWYCFIVSCDGSSNFKLRFYGEDGTFIEELTGVASAGSPDGDMQHTMGAHYQTSTATWAAGVVSSRVALMTAWPDNQLSETEQNNWAADPLNSNPGYVQDIILYDSGGTITEAGGVVTNRGQAESGTLINGAIVSAGIGPNVPPFTSMPDSLRSGGRLRQLRTLKAI